MKSISLVRKNAFMFSALLVILLILFNTIIVFYNNSVLKKTDEIQAGAIRAKHLSDQIWNQVIRNLDIGMRGYSLSKDEKLLAPYNDALKSKSLILKELRELTAKQGFSNDAVFDGYISAIDTYKATCDEMISLAMADKMEEFRALMKQDKGKDVWDIYERHNKILLAFEDDLYAQSVEYYNAANLRSTYIQTLLFILGIPTLLFMMTELRKDKKSRKKLFYELEKNNREYLFNPGTTLEAADEKEIIGNSINNFKKAAQFINQVSKGNLNADWEDLNNENKHLNVTNLAGELVQMREKMKEIKSEDEIRNWINQGVATFSDVIRKHQHDMKELCYEVLLFVTKYLKAQQGAIFIAHEDGSQNVQLHLQACYAFDRRKFLTKTIEAGEGLIGQIYLEGLPVLLSQVPEGYITITSGLGDTTPNSLVIFPMKYNDKVEAILEIASFYKIEQYQMNFLEKIGEIFAATLGGVKNNERTQILLEQFQEQTERLRAQEEELRQNMEEMEATQEAMRRSELERS